MKTVTGLHRLINRADRVCAQLRDPCSRPDLDSAIDLIRAMSDELSARLQPDRELLIQTAASLFPGLVHPNWTSSSAVRSAVTLARELVAVVDEVKQPG